MKYYKIVDDLLEKELQVRFPNIDKVLDMEDTTTYTQASISIFDHWLSEEEASEQLNQVSPTEQRKRDGKHFVFSELLIEKMKVFGFIYFQEMGQRKFVDFISEKHLMKYMKESSHFCVVIPDIESIYLCGFDDTNHLYFKNKTTLKQIEPLAKQASLYLL